MPDISVVIPLYNKQALILRSVGSVLAAAGDRDIEVVVIDDGSTDEGPELIRALAEKDSRIRVISQENQGAGATRNRAVAESRAPLVSFLDADDEWYPDQLDVIEGLIERFPQCGTFATAYCMAWPNGVVEPLPFHNVPTDPEGGVLDSYFAAARSSAVCSSAVCMRREVFDAAGGFPAHLNVGQDILCWAAASLVAPVAWSPRVTAVYYREAINYSALRWNPERHQMMIDAFRALADRPGVDDKTKAEIEAHCAYQLDMKVKVAKYGGHDRVAWETLREIVRDRGAWHARWLFVRCVLPRPVMGIVSEVKRRSRGLVRS